MKSNWAQIVVVLLIAGSCTSDNSRSLSLSPEILSLAPGQQSKRYASNFGDTISLQVMSNESFTEDLSSNIAAGSVGEYNVIEAEARRYIFGTDSPYYSFQYAFSTEIQGLSAREQIDRLKLTFEDASGLKEESLSIDYTVDVLEFDPSLVIYQDSVNLIDKTYRDVFSPNAGNSSQQFFFTLEQGIVGFVDGDNIVYELID